VNRHVILVGLSGAGKTTVGRLAAARSPLLFPEFADLDELIQLEAGRPIAEIFARAGEAEFRRLERAAMARALARPPHLIAAGAGWIAAPGNLDAARARGALTVYLRIDPELAARRLAGDASRPLLAGDDRAARLRSLLEARQAAYGQASAALDASGPLEEVVASLVAILEAA